MFGRSTRRELDEMRPTEFLDRRHGCFRFLGSSYFRQAIFTLIPLIVLVGIVAAINGKDSAERTHTATTVTISSGTAITHLIKQEFQDQIDAIATLTQVIRNRVWVDPFGVDEFLDFAFPAFIVDPHLHRIGVMHNDQGFSYISLADPNVAKKLSTADTGGMTFWNPTLQSTVQDMHASGEMQTRLYTSGVLTKFARNFSQARTAQYVALPAGVQTRSRDQMLKSPWRTLFDGSTAETVNWGRWLGVNSSYLLDGDSDPAVPSLIFFAPIVNRQEDAGGRVVGRVIIKPETFATLFSTYTDGVASTREYALLIDRSTRIIMAANVPELRGQPTTALPLLAAFPELFTFPQFIEINDTVRSPYKVIASFPAVEFSDFMLVTFRIEGTLDLHYAAVAPATLLLRDAMRLAMTIRYLAQSGDWYDPVDIPQLEMAVGGVFAGVTGTVGSVWLTTQLNQTVTRIYLMPDGVTPIVETWWPSTGELPMRQYTTVTRGSTGMRMLARTQWTDISLNPSITRTDPATALKFAYNLAVRAPEGTVSLAGPYVETELGCQAGGVKCQFLYMMVASCALWPVGSVPVSSPAIDQNLVPNRSCFALQFSLNEVVAALHGMRLDLVGLTIVAFENGTVLAAAGQGIDSYTPYDGTQVAWKMVPDWGEASFKLLTGTGSGQTLDVGTRHFILDRVSLPVISAAGNIIIITVIEDVVSDDVTRTHLVYAIDIVVVLGAFAFAAHAVHFLWHMRAMTRVANIVDCAAELRTDELPEEALRVVSMNKDIESMLISAVQLFMHMRRIRGCLPDFILDRHMRRGIVSAAPITDGERSLNMNGSRSEASTDVPPAGVFSELEGQRQFVMDRQHMVFVSVMFPSVRFVSSAVGKNLFVNLHKLARQQGGKHFITDDHLVCHFYFHGDLLTRAVDTAKAFAVAAPQCVIIVCRGDATFGVVTPDAKERSFAMIGPVVDAVQCMAACAREILGCGEAIAQRNHDERDEDQSRTTSQADARRTAPVLFDFDTLNRVDAQCLEGCQTRTIGALASDLSIVDMLTMTEVGAAVNQGVVPELHALRRAVGPDTISLREMLVLSSEKEQMDETQKLLWRAIGDAAAAVVEGRRNDAASLLDVINQHRDNLGVFLVSTWDRALHSAIVCAAGVEIIV
jgi:hypothetical protein